VNRQYRRFTDDEVRQHLRHQSSCELNEQITAAAAATSAACAENQTRLKCASIRKDNAIGPKCNCNRSCNSVEIWLSQSAKQTIISIRWSQQTV